MSNFPTFAGVQFACVDDIGDSEHDFADMSPESEVAEILETLSPSSFAMRRCLLRSTDFGVDGGKTLVLIQAQEADLRAVELAASRTVKVRDIETGSDTSIDFLSSKGGKGDIKSLSLAFASYDLVIAIRSDPMSLPAARLVDQTVDLRRLASEDVEAALRRMDPDDAFSMPSTFVWPEGLSLAALDLVCAKTARASDVVEKILSLGERRGEIVPEALGLDDLFGYGDAEIWARRLVEEMAAYRAGALSWRDVDSGMLLVGPPGTGKTELARRIAGAANLQLVSTSYAEWQSAGDGHLGDVTKAIRATFDRAREHAPSLVFIDEIDSLPARGTTRYAEWYTSIVNALLEALDGRDGRQGVVVVAACNADDRIDPALTRPGRLNRVVRVPLPDAAALSGILASKLDGAFAAADLLPLVTTSEGSASGADMTRVARDVRRMARKAGREVTLEDVREAMFPPDDRSDDDLRRVAVHEAGHVVAAFAQGDVPFFASVVSAWGTQGSVSYDPKRSTVFTTDTLRAQLTRLLAGRAAEEVVLGSVSTGSGGGPRSDLALATGLAVTIAGTSGLTTLLYDQSPDRRTVADILSCAYAETTKIVVRHERSLAALASLLVDRRVLLRSDLLEFARDHGFTSAVTSASEDVR